MKKSIFICIIILIISGFITCDAAQTNKVGSNVKRLFNFETATEQDINELVIVIKTVFPTIKQLENKDFKIGQTFNGCFDMYYAKICWDFSWEAYIGWKVKPTSIDFIRYNATYIPYAKVTMGTGFKGSSDFFEGEFRTNSIVFNSEFPTTAQFDFNEHQLCWKSDLVFYNPSSEVYVQSQVRECMQDVEKAARTGDYSWVCNFNSPLKITLLNNTALSTVNNIIPRTCMTLY